MASPIEALTVIAEFAVSPQHREEFLELCAFDSTRSTQDEAGCRQFDVNTSSESPNVVVLYEVYDSQEAFDVHLKTPHFAKFAEGVERLGVVRTSLRMLHRHKSNTKLHGV